MFFEPLKPKHGFGKNTCNAYVLPSSYLKNTRGKKTKTKKLMDVHNSVMIVAGGWGGGGREGKWEVRKCNNRAKRFEQTLPRNI